MEPCLKVGWARGRRALSPCAVAVTAPFRALTNGSEHQTWDRLQELRDFPPPGGDGSKEIPSPWQVGEVGGSVH